MQAARGTPLNPSEPPTPGEPANDVLANRRWWLFAVVALIAYGIDVGTKILAVERLAARPDVEVLGTFLTLRLIRNPGASFSMATDFTAVLSLLAITAVVVMLWLSRTVVDRIWAVGLGLATAGVAGNLTDRIFRDPGPLQGHVIDFLRLPNWPVFNVADICINLGIGLIILQVLRGINRDGSREPADRDTKTESTPTEGDE